MFTVCNFVDIKIFFVMPFMACLINMFTSDNKVVIFAVRVDKGWGA